MKNTIKTIIAMLLLIPSISYGAFAVPWNATSTTQGWISPGKVNGVDQIPVAPIYIATSTTASSTFANGLNLTDGCFSISGVCVTSGSASLSGGSPNTLTYWITDTTVGATSSPTVGYITATSTDAATSTFMGGVSVGTSTSYGVLTVDKSAAIKGLVLRQAVGSTGNVFEAFNSTGSSRVTINENGSLGWTAATGVSVALTNNSAGNTPLSLTGSNGQTANLVNMPTSNTNSRQKFVIDHEGSVIIGTSTASNCGRVCINATSSASSLPLFGIYTPTTAAAATSSKFQIDALANIHSTSTYAKFGPSNPIANCNYGVGCLELWGTDNTTTGVSMGIGNTSNGTSAFNCYFWNNDLANAAVTNFMAGCLNSSTYSDTTFGTGMAIPNQFSFQNSMGPISIIASTSTTQAYINFLTNSAATTSEVMRITASSTGMIGGSVGIGSTTPGLSKLVVQQQGSTGHVVVFEDQAADVSPTFIDEGGRFVSGNNARLGTGAFQVLGAGSSMGSILLATVDSTLVNTQSIGGLFAGSTDGSRTDGGVFRFVAAADWSSTQQATHIDFETSPRNDANPVRRMRIESEGPVLIGTTTGNAMLHIVSLATSTIDILRLASSTNDSVWKVDSNRHEVHDSTVAPAVSSCGTSPTISSGANDHAGKVTLGTSIGVDTSCTVTFAVPFTRAPSCMVNNESQILLLQAVTTTTTMTINVATTFTDSDVISYSCQI